MLTNESVSTTTTPYRVKVVVLAEGERLPLLIRRDDGLPLHDPTMFILTQVRGRARAANTIERYLRAIAHLLIFADQQGIDLDQRMRTGRLLDLHELDALAAAAALPISELLASKGSRELNGRPQNGKLRSLEKFRASQRQGKTASVAADSAGTRLRYIRDYLKWLADRETGQIADQSTLAARRAATEQMVEGVNARVPRSSGTGARREGLSREEEDRLRQTLAPDSPDNPWKDRRVRVRNYLLVTWLLALGLRRGELLALRIDDIKPRNCEVLIERRHDARDDPRPRQPVVKTRGRLLPMQSLFEDTNHYVPEIRASVKGAARHPFLFVNLRNGQPLSFSAVAKIFRDIEDVLCFPLSPHRLRHSWNDRFSELMDSQQVPEPTERKVRSYLQGWKETSNTAAIYTRRHVQRAAWDAMSDMQTNIVKGLRDDKK